MSTTGVDPRVVELHDQALSLAPAGFVHEPGDCAICVTQSLDPSGVPSGWDSARPDEAATKKQPYGDVPYADPGYQSDDVKRYPIDTEAHARAAWTYINQESNARKYTADQLQKIKARIKAALKRFGVEVQDSAQVSEGGNPVPMETITQETHEALLDKAVRDATAKLEAEVVDLKGQNTGLIAERDQAQAEIATLKQENERLSKDLDVAQVKVKDAEDEVATLKADLVERDETARLDKLAGERSTQVRNLGLFTEEYIAEKASRWASLGDDEWVERLEELKLVKGQQTSGAGSTDAASAMTGSRQQGQPNSTSARRAVLGLN